MGERLDCRFVGPSFLLGSCNLLKLKGTVSRRLASQQSSSVHNTQPAVCRHLSLAGRAQAGLGCCRRDRQKRGAGEMASSNHAVQTHQLRRLNLAVTARVLRLDAVLRHCVFVHLMQAGRWVCMSRLCPQSFRAGQKPHTSMSLSHAEPQRQWESAANSVLWCRSFHHENRKRRLKICRPAARQICRTSNSRHAAQRPTSSRQAAAHTLQHSSGAWHRPVGWQISLTTTAAATVARPIPAAVGGASHQ